MRIKAIARDDPSVHSSKALKSFHASLYLMHMLETTDYLNFLEMGAVALGIHPDLAFVSTFYREIRQKVKGFQSRGIDGSSFEGK